MFYSNSDAGLLKFVDNPIKNIDYLIEKRTPLKFLDIVFYKLPFFRKHLSKEGRKGIFESRYIRILKKASVRTSGLREDSDELHSQEKFEEIISSFKRYFNISTPWKIDMANHEKKDVYDKYHLDIHLRKAFYHSDRVCEGLKLPTLFHNSIISNGVVWLSFMLSEVYFLLVNDVLEIEINGSDLLIFPSEGYESKVKSYWLSEKLENMSRFSDLESYRPIADLMSKNREIPYQMGETLVDLLMDKNFSIYPKYITTDIKNNERYKILREVVFFSMLLEINNLIGKKTLNKKYILKHKNISHETLDKIDREIINCSEIDLNDFSGFVSKVENGYKRGAVFFKLGVRMLAGYLLDPNKYTGGGKDFNSRVGDYFEKEYIFNHLEKISRFGYKKYDGFKAGNKSKIRGYDIDIVLEDTERNVFYFIQVKHKFAALPTYLAERCRFLVDEKINKGFDKQLITLRDNFYDEGIRNQMKSRGIDNATLENSHFILLHNIPFLNFYEHQGVLFYEWNLLRNCLQNGMIHKITKDDLATTSLGKKLILEDVDSIVSDYFESKEFDGAFQDEYLLYNNTWCHFDLGDLKAHCHYL